MSFARLARSPLLIAATLVLAPAAHAQLFRAYISSTGSDANPCTLAAPCRLLPAALTAVAANGEIWMLDSANYNTGPVSVAKSVSILAVPGTVGSLVGTSPQPALTVTGPSVKATLRNVRVVPVAGASTGHGIVAMAGAAVAIEGSVIAGFALSGVQVTGTTSSLRMSDSVSRENAGSGVLVEEGGEAHLTRVVLGGNAVSGARAVSSTDAWGPVTLAIIDSTMEGNDTGVLAHSSAANAVVMVSVQGSLVASNVSQGILASGVGPATIAATGNNLTGNLAGLSSIGTASKVYATSNLVAGNTYGLHQSGATSLLQSLGGNTVRGNATDKSGSITSVATE